MNNMMIYSAKWNETETFRMIPITAECPFNEAIYDPTEKVLAIISKDSKEKPMMMPRLSDKGLPIQVKTADGRLGLQEQRVILDTYYEYYISEKADIREFVEKFASNPSHKAFQAFIKEK
jgi:hypothetical protein